MLEACSSFAGTASRPVRRDEDMGPFTSIVDVPVTAPRRRASGTPLCALSHVCVSRLDEFILDLVRWKARVLLWNVEARAASLADEGVRNGVPRHEWLIERCSGEQRR